MYYIFPFPFGDFYFAVKQQVKNNYSIILTVALYWPCCSRDVYLIDNRLINDYKE